MFVILTWFSISLGWLVALIGGRCSRRVTHSREHRAEWLNIQWRRQQCRSRDPPRTKPARWL